MSGDAEETTLTVWCPWCVAAVPGVMASGEPVCRRHRLYAHPVLGASSD